MTVKEIIHSVEEICRKKEVSHLALFGPYATGDAMPTSDIDFIVWGCKDVPALREEVDRIPTLKRIDIFDYDSWNNQNLKEDMDEFRKQIY